MRTNFSFLTLSLGLLVSSCVEDGVGRYRVQSIGNAQRSVTAEVLSTRPVFIQVDNSGFGAATGAATGGLISINNSDSAPVLLAGIIAGSVIGNALESSINTHNGTEYIMKTETGLTLTVAQIDNGNDIFSAGDSVLLIYGYPHRLIRNPH